ncbi:hypothetical protein [Streptomyces sp. NPDC059828]|uniref:hypothetical protein n=1 Tax=Streptomyces sp. NPDC059828 TaxID=3346965 RepID=UPI00365A558C
MPSVVGLLEQRELTARRRVDDLREEADRLQAELAVAQREWNEWIIARSVGEVLAPGNDAVVGPAASEGLPAPDVQPARPEPAEVAPAPEERVDPVPRHEVAGMARHFVPLSTR